MIETWEDEGGYVSELDEKEPELKFERVSVCPCAFLGEECVGQQNLPKDEFCAKDHENSNTST